MQIDSQNQNQLAFQLRVSRAMAVGGKKAFHLMTHFSDLEQLKCASYQTLRTLKLNHHDVHAVCAIQAQRIETDLTWLATPKHRLIAYPDPAYPNILKEIPNPPALLYVIGDSRCLNTPQLAVVGSRNPSHLGQEMASEFACQLARWGLAVTSGLAIGVDAKAHLGALLSQGKTLAVLGSGVDVIYPKGHQNLYQKIAEQGCLISEFPLGTQPKPMHFPQRNRIISALSLGTLVVEATLKSGSLITAKLALEQNREVFAIPGNIHNPLAKGTNRLIKAGAKLVESVEDIIVELPPIIPLGKEDDLKNKKQVRQSLNALGLDSGKLLKCISYETTGMEQILDRCPFSIEKVNQLLLEMELDGYIKKTFNGYHRI